MALRGLGEGLSSQGETTTGPLQPLSVTYPGALPLLWCCSCHHASLPQNWNVLFCLSPGTAGTGWLLPDNCVNTNKGARLLGLKTYTAWPLVPLAHPSPLFQLLCLLFQRHFGLLKGGRSPSCTKFILSPVVNHGLPQEDLSLALWSLQLHVITGRLRALEDQGATWRHRDALFFTMLVSACIANLWLWMRQWCFTPPEPASPSSSSLFSLGCPCPSSFYLPAVLSSIGAIFQLWLHRLPGAGPSCWEVKEVWHSEGLHGLKCSHFGGWGGWHLVSTVTPVAGASCLPIRASWWLSQSWTLPLCPHRPFCSILCGRGLAVLSQFSSTLCTGLYTENALNKSSLIAANPGGWVSYIQDSCRDSPSEQSHCCRDWADAPLQESWFPLFPPPQSPLSSREPFYENSLAKSFLLLSCQWVLVGKLFFSSLSGPGIAGT